MSLSRRRSGGSVDDPGTISFEGILKISRIDCSFWGAPIFRLFCWDAFHGSKFKSPGVGRRRCI